MTIDVRRPKVEIVREFAAPRERVWRAWTDPRSLLQWLGPVDWPAIEVTADLREGGAWRACLQSTESGELLWQSGRYLEIVAPERLVYSFRWENENHEDGPGVDTTVSVLLSERPDGGTLMRFTHVGLASAQSATGHDRGWQSCFDRLDLFATRP
jgi:uncharacterized protein YndB with AHSA1/START domain